MQIQELKEQLPNSGGFKEIINIKPYLSYVEKKIICENIIEASLEQDENGLVKCDYFNRKLITDISFIINYTNIELGEEFLEDYDYLCEQGIVDYILNNVNKSDRYFIKDIVSKSISQRIRIGNSIENIVASKLEKFIQKIPDEKGIKSIIKEAKKQINGLKPENLEILKGVVSKQGGLN